MNKYLRNIVIIWIAIIIVRFIFKKFDIWSEYIIVENLLNIITYFGWILPFLLISIIKIKALKYSLFLLYSFVLIVFSFKLLFLGIMFFNDLMTSNGFEKVYEKTLNNKETFAIYKTPDSGAMGSCSSTIYCIQKNLFLGFVKRYSLNESEYELKQGIYSKIDSIFYQNDTIIFDNDNLTD
ncbi:hypothetical protein ACE1ET_20040 [Saccharicrinis sp. FJH62]|uniref:hypothetical protein n=1 Tax=Saccharicrinis sp. FJH62 TaxID=3344657 RepID=UPI0035D44C34